MSKRRRGRRGRGRRPFKNPFAKQKNPLSSPFPESIPKYLEQPSGIAFLAKPETRLMMKMMDALADYAFETVLKNIPPEQLSNYEVTELTEELRQEIQGQIQAEIGKAPHPEAVEPIWTSIDEHQQGRSEVIREIANPKQS